VLTTITGALTCRSTRMPRTPDEFAEGEVVEVREVGGLHHHGERRPRNIIDHNAAPESITSAPALLFRVPPNANPHLGY
jgi:hypothetical protein